MRKVLSLVALFAVLPAFPGSAGDQPELYFISPADGEQVEGPVKVVFGLHGMGIAPAGVERPGTGHHHLIIDAPLPAAGAPIPANDKHVHFGGGQTEAVIELLPGEHTLQLLLGDHLHRPFDPAVVSKKITITVLPAKK